MSTDRNAEQLLLIIGCSHAWVTREKPPSPMHAWQKATDNSVRIWMARPDVAGCDAKLTTW